MTSGMPTRRTLVPPPLPADFAKSHPTLAKLIEELGRLRAETGKVRGEIAALELRTPLARQKDETARIVAIREGKPDPGGASQNALAHQIGPLEKRLRDLRLAVPAVEADLVALHGEHGGEWGVEAHARVVEARAIAVEALAALTAAVQGVADAERLDAWCGGRKSLPVNVSVSSNRLRTSLIPIVDALDRIGRALVVREPEASASEAETEAEAPVREPMAVSL